MTDTADLNGSFMYAAYFPEVLSRALFTVHKKNDRST